jgi:hypothetical protein
MHSTMKEPVHVNRETNDSVFANELAEEGTKKPN